MFLPTVDLSINLDQLLPSSAHVATYSGAPLGALAEDDGDDTSTDYCFGPFICLPQVINVPPTKPT